MYCTDYLFAKPGFFRGYGRVLDIGSTRNIYNYSNSEREADYKAIRSDWNIIGNDIRKAVKEYGE